MFFGKTGRKQDSQYVVVLCKVWKWDAEKFVRAMGIFYNKLLLLGHGECVNFFEELGMREQHMYGMPWLRLGCFSYGKRIKKTI